MLYILIFVIIYYNKVNKQKKNFNLQLLQTLRKQEKNKSLSFYKIYCIFYNYCGFSFNTLNKTVNKNNFELLK
jgi:hypothetical protein